MEIYEIVKILKAKERELKHFLWNYKDMSGFNPKEKDHWKVERKERGLE